MTDLNKTENKTQSEDTSISPFGLSMIALSFYVGYKIVGIIMSAH